MKTTCRSALVTDLRQHGQRSVQVLHHSLMLAPPAVKIVMQREFSYLFGLYHWQHKAGTLLAAWHTCKQKVKAVSPSLPTSHRHQ